MVDFSPSLPCSALSPLLILYLFELLTIAEKAAYQVRLYVPYRTSEPDFQRQ
jgi:hypothetical protein